MRLYRYFRGLLETKHLWDVFTYLFFGGLTTVVNIATFSVAYQIFGLNWPFSNTISWLLSVAFAFVTNKLWVFHSITKTRSALLWELLKFFLARLASYGLDMFSMWILIDILDRNYLLSKIVTQILIVVVNYALSKMLIFNQGKANSKKYH